MFVYQMVHYGAPNSQNSLRLAPSTVASADELMFRDIPASCAAVLEKPRKISHKNQEMSCCFSWKSLVQFHQVARCGNEDQSHLKPMDNGFRDHLPICIHMPSCFRKPLIIADVRMPMTNMTIRIVAVTQIMLTCWF